MTQQAERRSEPPPVPVPDWKYTTERRQHSGDAFRKETKMINPRKRDVIRQRVHSRIREKMSGTAERPRLNVYRSLNHIYTQVIDDAKGVTLVSASTLAKKGEA